MNLNLNGKVVVVTGGASGIGEGITRAFAREGAIPVMLGRNPERAYKIIDELKSIGCRSHFIELELTDESQCRRGIEETVKQFSHIDCIVNNAGVNDSVGLDKSPEHFLSSIQKNLFHYFTILHYALPYLIQTKGNVINIGSKVAVTGQGGTSGYAASKGAIHALTREWALDLLKHGIRVNEVVPAEVWTPLYESWVNSFDDPSKKLEEINSKIPLGKRMTTTEEIANAVLFLASEKASHITGQHIFVDGGYTHLDRSLKH